MKAMDTKLFLAIAITTLTATTVNARSWRINNDVTQKAHFVSINAAMSSSDVVEGDTLYLDPGAEISGDQNVTKQVTIIGTGFNSDELPYGMGKIAGTLYLKAANTKLIGIYTTYPFTISANNIAIERCRCSGIWSSGNNCQYANIRNCYIYRSNNNNVILGRGSDSNYSAFWTIENCIINYAPTSSYSHDCIQNLYNATISNNLIVNTSKSASSYCLSDIGNSKIINNIILQTTNSAQTINNVTLDQLNNNVLSSNTRPEYNRCNVLKTDSVYTGEVQEYVLTEDSPAKGYGQDGKDCGIFGGLYPFVKGGKPYGHPYFEEYSVSSHPENGKVNVSLKIKMQDE